MISPGSQGLGLVREANGLDFGEGVRGQFVVVRVDVADHARARRRLRAVVESLHRCGGPFGEDAERDIAVYAGLVRDLERAHWNPLLSSAPHGHGYRIAVRPGRRTAPARDRGCSLGVTCGGHAE